MEPYRLTSLDEILKHQSSQKPSFSGYPFQRTKSESGIPSEDDDVSGMFGGLHIKGSPPSSPHSLSPPALPLSSSSMPDPRTFQAMIANLEEKSMEKHSVAENKCKYNKGSGTNEEKLLPPPISYLRSSKTGKPFVYFNLDENSGRFVRKEIRIPRDGVLASQRENGQLKLNFAYEEEQEEEEEA